MLVYRNQEHKILKMANKLYKGNQYKLPRCTGVMHAHASEMVGQSFMKLSDYRGASLYHLIDEFMGESPYLATDTLATAHKLGLLHGGAQATYILEACGVYTLFNTARRIGSQILYEDIPKTDQLPNIGGPPDPRLDEIRQFNPLLLETWDTPSLPEYEEMRPFTSFAIATVHDSFQSAAVRLKS